MTFIYTMKTNEGTFLVSDSISGTSKFLYSVKLLELYGNEHSLNSGRFEYFLDDTNMAYSIPIEIDNYKNKNATMFVMRQYIESIAEHIINFRTDRNWEETDRWSIMVEHQSVGKMNITFYFTNLKLAMYLKLKW